MFHRRSPSPCLSLWHVLLYVVHMSLCSSFFTLSPPHGRENCLFNQRQFALMKKKDYRYRQWNLSCITLTEVTGLISKCLDCKVTTKRDLSPRWFYFRFINSNCEVAFWPHVRAAHKYIGGQSVGTKFTKQQLGNGFFFIQINLLCGSWPNRSTGCFLVYKTTFASGAYVKSVYFCGKALTVHPVISCDMKSWITVFRAFSLLMWDPAEFFSWKRIQWKVFFVSHVLHSSVILTL